MGVLANHVPSIEQLKPGLVEIIEDEDWETRERERRDSVFDDEPVREKTVRFRRIKRTRTDEWKPLSGWRRS